MTILGSPDGQEICFVNDGGFRELSKETGEKIDWERYERLNKEQKEHMVKVDEKNVLAWDADI